MRCRAAALVALLAAGCTAEGAGRSTLALAPCRLPGLDRVAECATLPVPLDRNAPEGPKLELSVVVIRARGGEASAPPLLLLAGGPGQAASTAYPPILALLPDVARTRDVVLVDQRGTGRSAPIDCPDDEDELQDAFHPRGIERAARRCVGELGAVAGDLNHYDTPSAVADLEDVRIALGADSIDLYGSSYGSRLALAYARRHPARVRAMILDAVAPPSLRIPLPLARDAQRAFDAMVARCQADPGCAQAFPDPGRDFATVVERLAEPRKIPVQHPTTGAVEELTLSREAVALALRSLLYSPELTALMPLTLSQLVAGRWNGFVAQVAVLAAGIEEGMSMGLFLSVVCREDVPRIGDDEIEPATEGTFLGRALIDELRDACALWPVEPAPPADEPPLSVIFSPVLLASGEVDPVTPPPWAEEVAAALPHGRHLVVPGAAHGTAIRSCMPELLWRFLEAPAEVQGLDANCLRDEAPRFFVDFSGPRP
jgi:pimeloyl-ACP methyl ester carboxylesterase